ncbi:conserved membrane hypothetical protein [Tenacibaculum halocynthiae]|nr:hypothetical protein SAMN04487765_2276 [Tenacibaculum sp. MAR_2010_89]
MCYFCLMDYLKKVVNFYINSSIHVGFSVYAFMRLTELYFGLPYNEPLDFFVFYGTITGYNFVKYAGVAKLHHKSLTNNLKYIQVFSLVCFLLACYYLAHLKVKTLILTLPFGLLTLFYAVPFIGKLQKNLRNISYLKIIVVALVWAGVTVLLPIYDAGNQLDVKTFYMLFQRFLFVIVLILPFDIRDIKFDAISLQTIPRKIGIENTKKAGFFILMICLFLEFLIAEENVFRKVFFIVFLLFSTMLMRAKEEQSKYYSSFWVEAIPLLWWGMLLIF